MVKQRAHLNIGEPMCAAYGKKQKAKSKKQEPAMSHYSCRVSMIGRSAGRSSVAAAAYRSGQRLVCARTGTTHDYRKKRDVRHAFIMAPAGAPAWATNRQQLWDEVEAAEKRKDATLAREFTLAIPACLTDDQAKELLEKWAQAELVDRGMVADIAIHRPTDPTDKNLHAHIMVSTRSIDGAGFGKKVREWNDKNLLLAWRESWAEACNHAALKSGHQLAWTHLSLQDQVELAMASGDFVGAARASHAPSRHEGVQGRLARARYEQEAEATGVPVATLIAEDAARYHDDQGVIGTLAHNDAAATDKAAAYALAADMEQALAEVEDLKAAQYAALAESEAEEVEAGAVESEEAAPDAVLAEEAEEVTALAEEVSPAEAKRLHREAVAAMQALKKATDKHAADSKKVVDLEKSLKAAQDAASSHFEEPLWRKALHAVVRLVAGEAVAHSLVPKPANFYKAAQAAEKIPTLNAQLAQARQAEAASRSELEAAKTTEDAACRARQVVPGHVWRQLQEEKQQAQAQAQAAELEQARQEQVQWIAACDEKIQQLRGLQGKIHGASEGLDGVRTDWIVSDGGLRRPAIAHDVPAGCQGRLAYADRDLEEICADLEQKRRHPPQWHFLENQAMLAEVDAEAALAAAEDVIAIDQHHREEQRQREEFRMAQVIRLEDHAPKAKPSGGMKF